jgi:hypothetical protein
VRFPGGYSVLCLEWSLSRREQNLALFSMNLHRTALRTFPKMIDAACYNRVRLALRRLGRPLRIALDHHRGLEVILDDQCWLCVDSFHNDMPILAWHRFDTADRWGLHVPVPCSLEVYHLHGGLVMGSVLEALEQALDQQLSSLSSRRCAPS